MSDRGFDTTLATEEGVGWHTKIEGFKNLGGQMTADPNDPNSFEHQNNIALANDELNSNLTAYRANNSQNPAVRLEEKNRRQTIQQASASVSAQIASQGIFNSVLSVVQDEMKSVRTDLQVAETRVEQTTEQLAETEQALEAADELIADEQADVVEATQQRDIRAQGQEGTEQVFDSAKDAYEAAKAAGDTAAMDAAARGMMQSSAQSANLERLTEESEIEIVEETEELQQAVEMRASVQEQIDSISKQLEEQTGDVESLRTQLAELESYNTYLQSDEVKAELEAGTLTMDKLEANGMPESVRAKMQEQLDNNSPAIANANAAPNSSLREITSTVESGVGTGLSSKDSFQMASTGVQEVSAPANSPQAPQVAVSTPAVQAQTFG